MAIGCSKPPASDETLNNNAPPKTSGWFGKKEVIVPAGTVITVRLANAVGSKLSNSGDQFNASVATPVEVDGKVVVPVVLKPRAKSSKPCLWVVSKAAQCS